MNRLPHNFFDDAEPFKIDGEPCKLIPLTKGFFAIVDLDDYPNLSRRKWYAVVKERGVYAARNKPRRRIDPSYPIYLHREIMGTGDGEECDHRFHNTLDCRKSQMRNCPKVNNTRNVQMHRDNISGYKGVTFHALRGKFSARICVDGKTKYLGFFVEATEAARRYDDEAVAVHGEFAQLNFPRRPENVA